MKLPLLLPLLTTLSFIPSISSTELATPTSTQNLTLNPPLDYLSSVKEDKRCYTNAECMKRGLPIMRQRKALSVRQSAGVGDYQWFEGVLAVYDIAGPLLGFLGGQLNAFGEYGSLVQNQNDAMVINFLTNPTKTVDHLNILVNPKSRTSNYKVFGGVTGFSSTSPNLGLGSYNYIYLSPSVIGTGAHPEPGIQNAFSDLTGVPEQVETSIWSFHPESNAITVQWTNDDWSPAPSVLVLSQDVLLIVGDPFKYGQTFGDYIAVRLEFRSSGGIPTPGF